MAWTDVDVTPGATLFKDIDQPRFYFVHSYYVAAQNRALVAASGDYGVSFDAALLTKNLFAVQFHPEKSADAGLQLLRNFVDWDGQAG